MSSLAAIPRVTGRHRNHALAAARAARAVELRTDGRTYQEIADELGYANRGGVHNLVAAALRAQTCEAVEELRTLELERLDLLQCSIWAAAMDGDVAAAAAVLKLVVARCRLLGLDVTTLHRQDAAPRTVVDPTRQ